MSRLFDTKNEKVSAYVCLTKPRILTMVLVMSAAGFFLGAKSLQPLDTFIIMLLGTALSSGGAAVLNHYIERDVDMMMHRTKTRPLPQGIVTPAEALEFGITLGGEAGIPFITSGKAEGSVNVTVEFSPKKDT